MADDEFQSKSLRFIENHDEERAAASLGVDKSKAAAVIMSTTKGMRLYYDGQLEGRRIKLPVQLGREPSEKNNECLSNFYKTLFRITNNEIFKYGSWTLIDSKPEWKGSKTFNNILIWLIEYNGRKRLVVVNYSRETSQCRVNLDLTNYPE